MFHIASISVEKGRVRKTELGNALTSTSTELNAPGLLSATSGAGLYLPAYRSAAQQAGGHEAFATTLADNGGLIVYLDTPALDALPVASPLVAGAVFTLVIDASAGGRRLPLQATRHGNTVELRTTLAGDELKRVRTALFDATPNVAVEVAQAVPLAARLTEEFVQRNWANATVRAGLLGLFGGIPFDNPSTYFRMARSGDPDFPNQYLLLSCVYTTTVGVPSLPGYIQWQLNWNGRAYNYYQDNQERARVFYLPDGFEFARGPSGSPSISLLQFSVPKQASLEVDINATFRYFGKPVVDAARIQNAGDVLRGKIGAAVQMLNIEDGHTIRKTFFQYLPNVQASSESGNLLPQQNASIDLVKGLRNELQLNLLQFRALWAAIFSSAPEKNLFRGWVDVELSGGRYQDRIEFNGRLPAEKPASFLDDILDVSATSTYPKEFTFRTAPAVFEAPSKVLEISLTFSGSQHLTLDKANNKVSIFLARPIRDLILGNQAPDHYPYRMQVVDNDGTIRCGNFTADSSIPLQWISKPMIASCGDCP